MTVPPGGEPYGQNPPGANPYGQYPYDPYGGDPSQPGPYPPAPVDPQGPYGWPGGPYAPPPKGPRSPLPWLIGGGVALLVVIGLVVFLAVHRSQGNGSAQGTLASNTTAPSGKAAPDTSEQTATDCTDNVSAGIPTNGDSISAGALSFPTSAAPGWTPFGDDSLPNAIDALGVAHEVPGASKWIMQAEVAESNFVTSMDPAAQAAKFLACVADGPGYANADPSLGTSKSSSIKVDGTDAARVDADITIGDSGRGVPGDSVVVIAVKTTPVTVFFAASPIGDSGSRAQIDAIIAALKVKK